MTPGKVMELYMLNRQHGMMILESVEHGPLLWPTVEEDGVTRLKKYSELSAAEAIHADCDVKATNIILQALPLEIYALVSTYKVAKDLWERIQMLMQGTSLTMQEWECKLYDEFDKFAMEDLNITIEEYIRLEEEKARRHDLKTDSENDNEKVNMPLFPSPEALIICVDDLDFFKDLENEFSTIVYNDAQMSKSGFIIELILSPQHIGEFDLNDETSLSKYDEEEQNNLYFNDLFPFNVIHPDDIKSEKDNDDKEIDIIQSSRGVLPSSLESAITRPPRLIFETLKKTLSCEPTVSSLNDEIDFRVLFDDYDDEDYTCSFTKEVTKFLVGSAGTLTAKVR
nr:hypothetical protein [Tanacetum cinerariifolium]